MGNIAPPPPAMEMLFAGRDPYPLGCCLGDHRSPHLRSQSHSRIDAVSTRAWHVHFILPFPLLGRSRQHRVQQTRSAHLDARSPTSDSRENLGSRAWLG